MAEAPVIEAQALRDFANLPGEVPEALLNEHIGIATRDLVARVGVAETPVGQEENWRDAIIARALASALPWLNTFALDGAAKVGRLEGSVEFRFLTPDDVDARRADLNARYSELAGRIASAAEEQSGERAASGSLVMMAV